MATIHIDLPDATVRAAREAGLLTSQALDRLLTDALQRKQPEEPARTMADSVLDSGNAEGGLWRDLPGTFWMASDFDDPLEDFKEYMG